MPSQIKIINAVNYCLKQRTNIDIELNDGGVCAGLAGLYVKYSLENKTPEFFKVLEQLGNLPKHYKLGDNQSLDNFIIQIERTFNSPQYSNYKTDQGDLDKILAINNKPISCELNLGLITSEDRWEEIINQITRENRSYLIGSNNHAIAFQYKNGQYTVYDPNYSKDTKVFTSTKEVIQELKLRFDYTQDAFGMSVRVFAHPEASPADYPNNTVLQQIAWKDEADIRRTVDLDGSTWQSSNFAYDARDHHTMNQLCKQNAIHLDHLRKEYLNYQFNDHLTKREPSPEVQRIILSSIKINIEAGNFDVVELLLSHYNSKFSSQDEKQQLDNVLLGTLLELNKDMFGLMRHAADCSYLIKLFEPFKDSEYEGAATNYNHLKIMTLIKEGPLPNAIELLLKHLSPEQLSKQIQLAATVNNHTVVTLLLNWLDQQKIDPKKLPSIYDENLINHVNSTLLKKLFDSGLVAEPTKPELLALCTRRKDKSIFDLYARSFSEQTGQMDLWKSIDKSNYELLNLEDKIGPIALINALILLRKNEHIRNALNPAISTNTVKSALADAIMVGSGEISKLLQDHLKTRNETLDADTVDYLCQKALEDNNLDILIILSRLNYNIFIKLADVKAILRLCSHNNDFLVLEYSLDKASPAIKKALLETSLKYGYFAAITVFKEQDPTVFVTLLNDWIAKPNTDEKRSYLSKINRVFSSIPAEQVEISLEGHDAKSFMVYAYQHQLFTLINRVTPKVTWTDLELKQLITDLIDSANEAGLIQLFKTYPNLGQEPSLIKTLAEKNLLNTIAHLLSVKTVIEDPNFYIDLATSSIKANNKNLIGLLIQQGKITPLTPFNPKLTDLLKECIEKGFLNSLEPFIHSPVDFGLDFKGLFQLSCEQKQAKIANELLTQKFDLTEDDILQSMKQLFGEQSHKVYFETVYQNAFGRLYGLLLKTNMRNPHGPLLQSIKNPSRDPKFQKTALYLLPLKQAVKEKNMELFNTLFKESSLPAELDKDIIKFLNDPLLSPSVLNIFEQKYTLEKLLTLAIQLKEWSAVANLLEPHRMIELSPAMQELIQTNGDSIIQHFIKNLEKHAEQEDLRPRLANLRLVESNPKALAVLARPHYDAIQSVLVAIELAMIKRNADLNGQVYRYSFDSKSFENALKQLNEAFTQCHLIIQNQKINLDKPITSSELIMAFAQAKEIMAKNDITPYYLSEEDEDLLFKLAENPRFKKVCEHELQLYAFTKEFNLAEKNLAAQTVPNQLKFNDTVAALYRDLTADELPSNFVITQIQPFLKEVQDLADLKALSYKGIKTYLDHRDDTLGIFSWLFDYDRGEIRANHYLNLMNQAKTLEELQLIHYAILVNPSGMQLKQDMAKELGCADVTEAKSKLKQSLLTPTFRNRSVFLDQLIESINEKVNDNDPSPTETLLQKELEGLSRIFRPEPNSNRFSFFQNAANQSTISWWKWFTQWFRSDNSNEDKLTPG